MISREWAKKYVMAHIEVESAKAKQTGDLEASMYWTTLLLFMNDLHHNQPTHILRSIVQKLIESADEMEQKLEGAAPQFVLGQRRAITFMEELINDLEPTKEDLILWAQNGQPTKPGAYGKLMNSMETSRGFVDAGTKCTVITVLDDGILAINIMEAPGGTAMIPYFAFGKIE